jgi:transposase
MKRADRREKMIAALARREQEGLSYRELSQELGISRWTLYEWSRRLRREKEGLRDQEKRAPVSFVEVAPAEEERAAIEVFLGSRRLRIERGFDRETLLRLVEALESC